MMTVHKLSVGDGYTYYTHEVASGDALRANDRELGDYYTVDGLPPGQWVGSSVHHLGVSGNVTEAQMHALFGGTSRPMSPEQFAEIEEQANQLHVRTYSASVKEQREEIMRKSYDLLYANVVEGKSQEMIGKSLGIDQRGVSHRIAALEENGWSKQRFKLEQPTYEDFTARFKFTDYQKSRIEKVATTTANEAAETYRKKEGLNLVTPQYPGVSTAFKDLVQKRIDDHERIQGQEATAAEKRNYRLALGAARFREEHQYEPENEELIRYIQRLENPKQQAIAGYDLVFSPTKSVSIAWGIGNETLRNGIEAAHEKAIKDVVDYLEKNALYTRRGQGGLEQIDVDGGIIATKFRHYDSREGDPNIHDHLVIANRVLGADGKWSTIDGRNIYGYGVAASELYNTKITQYIHQNLGLEFTQVAQGGRTIFELAGIEPEAIKAFSSRRAAISKEYEKAHQQFVADHGYEPNERQVKQLYQQVTLSTRPTKSEARSLKDLNELWEQKAQNVKDVSLPTGDELETHLRAQSNEVAEKVIEQQAQVLLRTPQQHAYNIIEDLGNQRSVWSNRHIVAETHRYFRNITSGSFVEDKVFQATLQAIKQSSVSLHVTDTLEVPKEKLRADGSSVYTRVDSQLYTSTRVIRAEQNIVSAALTPVISPAHQMAFELELAKHKEKNQISPAQENMARAFTTSNKLLAVGIGPAGAGKTTSTKLTVKTIKSVGATVHGLAPTAAAAQVISEELDITATTLDYFLAAGPAINSGDVILVDEIGMVPTPKLNTLIQVARDKGAVIRGMGDTRQLSAVGAGGALRLIEREAGATYLEDVFRFRNEDGGLNMEEVNASLALREPAYDTVDKPFTWYLENERVTAGSSEAMTEKIFNAWSKDVDAGKNSIMLASTNSIVHELNLRAQVRAIARGEVDDKKGGVILSDNSTAYPGDLIVTRKNQRKLTTRGGKDFVKNGDQWEILKIKDDGSLTVRHTKHKGKVTLPAAYVSAKAELGYALTVHRAQGETVDTVHAYIDSSTSRASAYVALTRGKFSNQIYVATNEETTRDDVLATVTENYDRNLSVHEEMERLRAADRDVATRIKIYNSLAEHSMQDSHKTLVRHALGEGVGNKVIAAEAFGALAHELDKTYRAGIDPTAALSRAYNYRELDSSRDIAAVLQWRLKATVEHHNKVVEKKNSRPLGNYSDETIKSMLQRAEARLPKNLDKSKLEDPNWADRPYALVKTDKLQEMRIRTFALLRSKEDARELYIDDLRENAYAMDNEWGRRAQMSPPQKTIEQYVRGDKDAGHLYTIAGALRSEMRLRESAIPMLPEARYTPQPKDRVIANVSGHSADPFWMNNPLVKPENRAILKAHRKEIGELITLRGKQIAADPPAWAKELGEVPAYGPNAKRWYRVAGEVDAYRTHYKIPEGEPVAIPRSYQESERGAYLQAEITAVHKSSRLSSSLLSDEHKAIKAQQAVLERAEKEVPTEVEYALNVGDNSTRIANLTERIEEIEQQQGKLQDQLSQLTSEVTSLTEQIQEATVVAEQKTELFEKLHQEVRMEVDRQFYPIRIAQRELDAAGFFARSKIKGKVDTALSAFAQAHGGLKDPAEVKDKWVPKRADIKAARTEQDQAVKHLGELKETLAQKQQTSNQHSNQHSNLSRDRGRLRQQRAAYSETVTQRKDRLASTTILTPSKATQHKVPIQEHTR